MCGNKVENQGESSQTLHEYFQAFQDELLHQHQQHQYNTGEMRLPQASSVLSWSNPPVHDHTINSVQFAPNPVRDLGQFAPSSSYTGLYTPIAASSLQFSAHEGSSSNPFGVAGLHGGSECLLPNGSASFILQTELGKVTAQEMMDAKALAASKSHSEAERRRRERINKHLARLRSLLPSTTKTDKASLLAEVIQHVKDLKRQTSEIAEQTPFPTDVDELTVNATDHRDGKLVIKASLCCDDRSDLLPDIIKTLKALRLRALKAEMTTLGGRVKNVFLITGEEDSSNSSEHSIDSIQDALKAVMERAAPYDLSSSAILKRQKTKISII